LEKRGIRIVLGTAAFLLVEALLLVLLYKIEVAMEADAIVEELLILMHVL
jgi:hypothetical protein